MEVKRYSIYTSCFFSNFPRENRIHYSPLNSILSITPAEIDIPHSYKQTVNRRPPRITATAISLPTPRPDTRFSSVGSDFDLLLSYGAREDHTKTPAPSRLSNATTAWPGCIRSRPRFDEDSPRQVNSLSRQSCDVLGPQSCHECDKLNRREENASQCEQSYPLLYMSDDNIAAAALIKHSIPTIGDYELQDKVTRGEIAVSTSFRERTHRIESARTSRSEPTTAKSMRSLVGDVFYSQTFDLKRKEKAEERKLKFMKSMAKRFSSASEALPTFVSSRRVKKERPRYTASYDPPLLTVVCQNVEPAFFAGSNDQHPEQSRENK